MDQCAMAKYILDHNLAKTRTLCIEKWVNKFEEFKKSLEPYTLEYVPRR